MVERGPVALAGSGEFLDVMTPVDAALLDGRPRRAVVLPTAAAQEGDTRIAYWLELGCRHFEAMGVEPVPLDVRTRGDADDPATAALVEGAGLVYLSGGDPHHLSGTLRGTALLTAIRAAWESGTALGGCSAGAMALTSGAPEDLLPPGRTPAAHPSGGGPPDRRPAGGGTPNGLGLIGGLAVIPHYDQMERWRPGVLARFSAWQPRATTLVGIEERTALVGAAGGWEVRGAGAVWVIGPGGRQRFGNGAEVPLGAPAP